MSTSEQEEMFRWVDREQDREIACQWAEEQSALLRARTRDGDMEDMARRKALCRQS